MRGEGFTRLESERRILRRFTKSDMALFLAYRNDPEVARYRAWESCTEGDAAAMIEELKALQPSTRGEWFQFAIELRETGTLVGDCAIKVEQDGRQAEVGFTLAREHRGKGYAPGAVSRLLDYAFGDLGCTGSSLSRIRRTSIPLRCSNHSGCVRRAASPRIPGSRADGPANTCRPY